MATTDTTGLVRNTDFSAELLLNKVMNKQYKTQNGNTLTLAGRLNASNLDSQAQGYGVLAGNVAKAATFADATENALTEMLDLAKRVQGAANSTSDTAAMQKLGTALQSEYDSLLASSVDNVALIGGTKEAKLGLGSSSITLGSADYGTAGALGNLKTALAAMSAGSTTTDPTTLDTTISQLNAAVAAEGSKASVLHNRYDALNDLSASYLQASNDQAVTAGGSASSLLNSLL